MAIPFIEDFGGGTGVADNTPAFNAAVLAGSAVQFRETWPNYIFTTEPNAINKQFYVYGARPGMASSNLVRNYAASSPTRGLFHWVGTQCCMSDLYILSGGGTNGAAVSIVPPVGGAFGLASLHNIRVTVNGGLWDYSVFVDGSNLASPIGVRELDMRNVVLFGANIRSAFFKSVVHLNWHGGAINQAGGTNGGMEITGTSAAPSSENTISLDYMSHNLVLDRVKNTTFSVGEMGSSVTNTANTSGIVGRGVLLGGAPQNSWVNSSWQSGRTNYVSPV